MVSPSPNNGLFSLRKRKKCALLSGAFFLSNGRLKPSILSMTGLGTQQRRADFDDMLLSRQIIADDLECRTSLSLVVTLTDRSRSRRVFTEARNTMSCLSSKADHKWISTNLARPLACRNVVGLHRCLQNYPRDLYGSRQLSQQWTDFTFHDVNLSCREGNFYVAKLDPRTAKRDFRLSIGRVPLPTPVQQSTDCRMAPFNTWSILLVVRAAQEGKVDLDNGS
jgi:hypothetical protein